MKGPKHNLKMLQTIFSSLRVNFQKTQMASVENEPTTPPPSDTFWRLNVGGGGGLVKLKKISLDPPWGM